MHPSDVHVLVNDSAQFTCRASGSPPPKFMWLYNNGQVTSGSKFFIQTTQFESKLTVYDVQPSDNGTVVCVVENAVTAATPTEVRSSTANLIPEGVCTLAIILYINGCTKVSGSFV